MFQECFVGVCACVFVLFFYFFNNKSREINMKLPPTPYKYALSNIRMYAKCTSSEGVLNLATKLVKDNNGIFYIDMYFTGKLCVIASLSYIKEFMKHTEQLDKPTMVYNNVFVLEKGLATLPGVKWRTRRKLVAPVFSSKYLRKYVAATEKHTKTLIDQLDTYANGRDFNCLLLLQQTIFSITFENTTGIDVVLLNTEELQSLLNAVEECVKFTDMETTYLYIFYILKKIGYKPTAYNQFYKQRNMFIKKVKEYLVQLKNGGLISSADERYFHKLSSLNEEDKWFEMQTILGAGYETTSTIICQCLALLGINQTQQELAYEEQLDLFSDTLKPTDFGSKLHQMSYLEACVNETLRLAPVIPMIGRRLSNDITLGEYDIPQGTNLFIHISTYHRDPTIWEKPNEFYPEHFSTEQISRRPSGTFIPFGCGPRICIGYQYAMQSMKTMLSSIIRSYKIECDLKTEDIRSNRIFTSSAEQIQLRLTPRHPK